MNSENNHVIKPNQSLDANHDVDKSKRSFAKAGVLAPVIMTLTSRSALGTPICAPSGFVSATTTTVSGTNQIVGSCGGFSPGAYQTPYNGDGNWVNPYSPGGADSAIYPEGEGKRAASNDSKNKKDDDINDEKDNRYENRATSIGTLMSAGFSYPDGYLAKRTMYDVLWMSGNDDPDQLGGHLVAALLNAAAGLYAPAHGLTVADIKDMYKQLSITGNYSPASGVTWTAQQVVAFLEQTWN